MEIVTEIKLDKEDIIQLIIDKYQVKGDINFIFEEETYKYGWTDGVQNYKTRSVFKGITIKNSKNER